MVYLRYDGPAQGAVSRSCFWLCVLLWGPHTMTGAAIGMERLSVTEQAVMMRELRRSMKDKPYLKHPIGREVDRYIRQLKWADAPQNTIDAYETVLNRLALDHADFKGLDRFAGQIGTEYLREFLHNNWGDSASATKAQRLRVLRAFFEWAVGEGKLEANPVRQIKAPRIGEADRLAYPRETLQKLIMAQESLRDQCCLQLLCRMAFRKDELRRVKVGEIDLTRNLIAVHGKGRKDALMPLKHTDLINDLYLHILGDSREQHEYLLFPQGRRDEPMTAPSVHRWFKRCVEKAGLPATMKLHEMRHSAADELWRTTGNIVKAKQLLRHSSSGTTEMYLHPTREDLADGLEVVDALWASDGWRDK